MRSAEFHDLPLQPHPAGGAGPLHSLRVSGTLDADGRITLDYLLEGGLLRVRLPEPARAPRRRDGLWRHTCVELFARRAGIASYLEFNFSPAGDWAAYAFDAYRQGQTRPELAQPGITLQALGAGRLRLQARAQLPPGAAAAAHDGSWQLGFAAVIETSDGSLSYWAAHHPAAQPDFHAPGNFSLVLEPGGGTAGTRASVP